MAYRYGNRRQTMLFPQSIDEYIPSDAPVRAYDVFVDALDFEALGIDIDSGKVGYLSFIFCYGHFLKTTCRAGVTGPTDG